MLESENPPAGLSQYTGFLLNWVANRSRLQFARRLEERCGLHPREFGVLSVLAETPGMTQQAICEGAGVDPSTMVATLDSLEARGLARRRPDPEDRRKRAVHLTAEGERVLREGQRTAAAAGREVFGSLTADEHEQLQALLRKLSGLGAA